MVTASPSAEKVWAILRTIPDPEIPVLSLVDLRIVRDVRVEGEDVTVELRPTFSGCPALDHMRETVVETLKENGYARVTVDVNVRASWSTEELSDEARASLAAYGIAPPPSLSDGLAKALDAPVPCPHCGSESTRLDSPFGSTLCKQLFLCDACHQPFERFKPL